MQITREDLNPCTVQLTIVCDPSEVRHGFDRALKQMGKKVKVPGFRPGTAPRAMLEPLVDKVAWTDEAAEEIVRTTYNQALKDQGLTPDRGVRPNVNLTKIEMGNGADVEYKAEYTVKVPLPAVVELGDLNGLEVEKPKATVTEEEIDFQIEELRKRRSTREAITDRGIQEGDVAVVNVKVVGEAGDGRNFMTIAGQTFPELDQALMGMHVEETKALDLPFPTNFQEPDWAGQTLHAQVSVNSLNSVRLPEVDEEFARSLQTETVDDLRQRIRQGLTTAKTNLSREIVNEQLLDKLQQRSKVLVSDNMWETLAARRLQETAEEQHKGGKTIEQYAKDNNMTMDELVAYWKEKAKVHVERALVIRDVFAGQKLELNNADLSAELVAMGQEYNVPPDDVLATLEKSGSLDELHFRAISRKVGDFLAERAKVVEV